jgi:hypothetical protein
MSIKIPCTAANEHECAYHNALRAQEAALARKDAFGYQVASRQLAAATEQPTHVAEIEAYFELRRQAEARSQETAERFAKERQAVEASRDSAAVKQARLRSIREREASVQAYNAGLAVLAELREGERITSSEYMHRVQRYGASTIEDAQRTFFWLQDAHELDLDLLYGVGRPTV